MTGEQLFNVGVRKCHAIVPGRPTTIVEDHVVLVYLSQDRAISNRPVPLPVASPWADGRLDKKFDVMKSRIEGDSDCPAAPFLASRGSAGRGSQEFDKTTVDISVV
jgi:hypothetical protein